VFSTAADDQPSVEVHVLEGERAMVRDNRSVGRLQLRGILPARRGVPQIEVTFSVDKAGVLEVRARDLATGETQLFVTSSAVAPALDQRGVDHLLADAAIGHDADERFRKLAQARLALESSIYSGRKLLVDYADRLPDDIRARCSRALEAAQAALAAKDAAKIEAAQVKLRMEVHAATEVIYRSGAKQ